MANFCFLTQQTNLAIGMRAPQEYFGEVDRHPGALESQWIPTDEALWQVDRYPDFLAARRELLAQAANTLHAELRDGSKPTAELTPVGVIADDELDDDTRVAGIKALIDDFTAAGYAAPETDAEIADPDGGQVLAMAEAFWPDGLQPGLGDPLVLELDGSAADMARLEKLGYQVFTSIDAFRGYAARRSAESAGVAR